MLAPVHQDLVRSGAFSPVVFGGAEERLWLDCDLASLAENRLGDTLDPRDLDAARRAEWQSRATIERPEPLSVRQEYERCYWLLEDGQRAGTLALANEALGNRYLRVASLYVLPSFRGKGVGRRTLGRLEQALSRHDIGFRLDTSWCWQKTVGFYMAAGLWVHMWKRELVFCWDPWTPAPRIDVGEREASVAVPLDGAMVIVARAVRHETRLELDPGPEELANEKRLGSAYWHACSTLSLAVALRGWPLVRSREEWDRSYYADGGAPESLAYKITIWEAWNRHHGFLVSAPRIPGIEYPTWEELEARWEAERREYEAKVGTASYARFLGCCSGGPRRGNLGPPMITPLEVASLSGPAQKILAPGTPAKLKEMAARGVAPGVRPAELLTVIVALSASGEPSVRDAAEKTLSALPDPLLKAALDADLAGATIDGVARRVVDRPEAIARLLRMPQVRLETVEELARIGSEAVTEIVATNEERLLAHPRIVELLYFNKHTRASTVDRLVELMTRHGIDLKGIPAWKEVAAAIKGELIAEPSDEPLPDDVAFKAASELAERLAREAADGEDTHDETEEGEEKLKNKFLPLYQELAAMTPGQRIRRAQMGTREERMLLVRDTNRMVASAAVRSPAMQESEVVLITRNRNMSDDVLRIIASTPEWLKSYTVKRNLVENPKTPVMIAARLVEQLRESDLRKVSKSKNVTGPVQDAARRHLDRRKS